MNYEDDIANQVEEHYHKLILNEIDETVKHYLNYLESSHDAKIETLEKKTTTVYDAISLVNDYLGYYSAYSIMSCEILSDISSEISDDIDTSIFLSIHGKYKPANALLRRWLEINIIALYYDSELHKYNKTTKKFQDTQKKGYNWLSDPHHKKFTGNEFGILTTLIDPDTDYIATELLREKTYFKKTTFKKYVVDLYDELSKYVHYGGMKLFLGDIDDLHFDFAKFNDKFFNEWYLRLTQINEICNIITLLKFPEIITLSKEHDARFPTLESSQMIKLRKLLDNN